MAYGVETHKDKDGTVWIDVDNGSGLFLRLCSVGASTYEIKLRGTLMNLVPVPDQFLVSQQFFGKTLGRVAGRIPVDFEVDGNKLALIQDQAGFCLHGGKDRSLSFKNFKPTIAKGEKAIAVSFEYLSPAGEAGFPGNATVTVTYKVTRGHNEFSIGFRATADEDTPLSLTNHIYWDLGNANDVSGQVLTIKANEYGIGDGHSQLVRGIARIDPFLDFSTPAALGPKLDSIERRLPEKTIDHTFFFDGVRTDRPQVELSDGKVKLSLFTDMPAVNVYVDNSLTPVSFVNGSNLARKRRAIAFEPQEFYLLKPGIVLKKGRVFDHFERYVFSL